MKKTLFACMAFATVFAVTSCQSDEEPTQEPMATTGTATRNGNIEVKWVQLWENGPKFAEYNIGATKVESYGEYYKWSENIASEQWGSNWRLPTNAELQALISNCTVTWTNNYNGIIGKIFTGKGDYKDNSVFLPASGYSDKGEVILQGYLGTYWSSTPMDKDNTYTLDIDEMGEGGFYATRYNCYSVRAVLAE